LKLLNVSITISSTNDMAFRNQSNQSAGTPLIQ